MTLVLGEEYPKDGSEVPLRKCRREITLHRGLKSLGLRGSGPLEGPKVQMFPKESQDLSAHFRPQRRIIGQLLCGLHFDDGIVGKKSIKGQGCFPGAPGHV